MKCQTLCSLKNKKKISGFPSEIYLRGHMSLLTHILGTCGVFSGINCLNFTNIANVKETSMSL